MGVVSVIFFGTCAIFIGLKLFDKKVGLTINETGIIDNSNATSIGLIDWKDIIGVDKIEVTSTKILIIKTDVPDKYIERAKNRLAKRAMKANNKMYGSPISIISNSLKIKSQELEELITSEFLKRKK